MSNNVIVLEGRLTLIELTNNGLKLFRYLQTWEGRTGRVPDWL